MDGWVKIPRSFAIDGQMRLMPDHALRVWLHLKLTANWRPVNGLQMGQTLTSYRQLQKETGYGSASISKALKWLRESGYLVAEQLGPGLPLVVTMQEEADSGPLLQGAFQAEAPASLREAPSSHSEAPASQREAPPEEGCFPGESGVLSVEKRGASQTEAPTGLQTNSHKDSSHREEEKKKNVLLLEEERARTRDAPGWRKWYEKEFLKWPRSDKATTLDTAVLAGLEDQVVILALERGRDRLMKDPLSWAAGVVGNWFAAGVRTLADVSEYEQRQEEAMTDDRRGADTAGTDHARGPAGERVKPGRYPVERSATRGQRPGVPDKYAGLSL